MDAELKLIWAKFFRDLEQPKEKKDTRLYGTFLVHAGDDTFICTYNLKDNSMHSTAKLSDRQSDLSKEDIEELRQAMLEDLRTQPT